MGSGKEKRILWLLNHSTLREFEVPLLIELGFEVFVPKFFPEDESNGSASVSYEYDDTLTISKKDLDLLNETDFYSADYDRNVVDVINNHFLTAITGLFFPCFERLVDDFNGKIFLRAFLLDSNKNYFENIKSLRGEYFFNKLKMISDRFWFLAAYNQTITNETGLLQENAVFAPIANTPKQSFVQQISYSNERSGVLLTNTKPKTTINIYSKNEVKEFWFKNFAPLTMVCQSKKVITTQKPKRIAIILPISYRGGTLNGLRNIVRMLNHGSALDKTKIEIVIYCVRDYYDLKQDFSDVMNDNVIIREFFFKEHSYDEVKRMLRFSKSTTKLIESEHFYVLNDNYKAGTDCDFWILISDRCLKPIAPLRPYAIVIYDYIQRYIPQMLRDPTFDHFFSNGFSKTARMANLVLTTTPQTALDAKNYMGIEKQKIFSIAPHFDPLLQKKSPGNSISNFIKSQDGYFIWPTNTSTHKNIIKALKAIKEYLENNGTLNIIMTGVNTQKLDPKTKYNGTESLIHEIRHKINSHSVYNDRIFFMGDMEYTDYTHVLQSAKFLFHPTLIDNGTFSVLEAAVYGVPSASANYPQMCYMAEKFDLTMHFFDPHCINEMTKTLFWMEKYHQDYEKKLPSKDSMLEKSYLSFSKELWTVIQETMC